MAIDPRCQQVAYLIVVNQIPYMKSPIGQIDYGKMEFVLNS